ncbi:MAG TPA: xanthine dehydrogenase family protein subunit M [Spirochaetia bacterium]|nr:xanthine dehydrogenase family protein subunit M [Spirochaetia bacterium]
MPGDASPGFGFRLARPRSMEEALDLLSRYGPRARLLAGGTDLLVQVRAGKAAPEVVIDLKKVSTLHSDIVQEDSFLEIGALALLSDIGRDPRILGFFPALAESVATVGSIQIRNRATLPGNICNASPAADTLPALLVHEASVSLQGRGGKRTVALSDFFLGPGKTVRRDDEIVTSVRLPLPKGREGAAFERLTRRRGVDLATINLCCRVEQSGVTRFAFGAVGPRPVVAVDPSGKLMRPGLDAEERDRRIRELLRETSPISDVRASRDYRAAMLLVLSRRALERALQRLAGGEGA